MLVVVYFLDKFTSKLSKNNGILITKTRYSGVDNVV